MARQQSSYGRVYPPRGRGRGEALTSPRRIKAKLRALEAMKLHSAGMTWVAIAAKLGYKSRSGPLKAVDRMMADCDAYPRW
jgi:hypothetical protein